MCEYECGDDDDILSHRQCRLSVKRDLAPRSRAKHPRAGRVPWPPLHQQQSQDAYSLFDAIDTARDCDAAGVPATLVC
jgi:hypothetical protein